MKTSNDPAGLTWMKHLNARLSLAFRNWQLCHSASTKAIRVFTKEIKRVGLVTLFFLIGFGLILVDPCTEETLSCVESLVPQPK